MDKRGLSDVIVVVLLILLVVVATVAVYTVVRGLLKSSGEKSSSSLTCLQKVDLSVSDACYTENQIVFKVRNNLDLDYNTEFFILQIVRHNSTIPIPTQWGSNLKSLETRTLIAYVDNPGEIEKAILVPRFEKEKGVYCYAEKKEFSLKAC